MKIREKLDSLYNKYNKFELIHPDPLEFIYDYKLSEDQEIVALIASSLAYGRVAQILISVKKVLSILGEHPKQTLLKSDLDEIGLKLGLFKHRFTTGQEVHLLLKGIKAVLDKHGSLKVCFCKEDNNYLSRISKFASELNSFFDKNKSYLVPSPEDGSACKRLMLFLKWMIRKDEVDPGTWADTELLGDLIIPLDTHMYYISTELGFTKRKSADLKTALEITKNFRKLNHEDPTKYDFTLTRFGIRNDMQYQSLFDSINS